MSLNGAFWISKPEGLTSSDVVVRLKKTLTEFGYFNRFPEGPKGPKLNLKIGHGGTLDPFATGVLVILVGEGTKLADAYLHSTKSYRGIIALGSRTDTGDRTGSVVEEKPVSELPPAEWQALADTFTNELYWQTPPMYSAKKHQGQSLHHLARQGIEVERKAILKKIEEFHVRPLNANELEFQITCESGTYVRVIAEDLAKKAGMVGHLKTLERTQTSDAELKECLGLEPFIALLAEQTPLAAMTAFHPITKIAEHLPSIWVDPRRASDLKNGVVRTSQDVCFEAHHLYPTRRYALVRLNTPDHAPVALLENEFEHERFRLQRIIHA